MLAHEAHDILETLCLPPVPAFHFVLTTSSLCLTSYASGLPSHCCLSPCDCHASSSWLREPLIPQSCSSTCQVRISRYDQHNSSLRASPAGTKELSHTSITILTSTGSTTRSHCTSSISNMATINDLPNEILAQIFHQINLDDRKDQDLPSIHSPLLSTRCVCRAWSRIVIAILPTEIANFRSFKKTKIGDQRALIMLERRILEVRLSGIKMIAE